MAQRVKYNGEVHNFPDNATPDMISDALGLSSQESKQQTQQPPEQQQANDSIWETIKKKTRGGFPKEFQTTNPMDVIKMGLMGMGEAAQNIGELAAPLRKYIPEKMKIFPDVNMKEVFNAPKNPTLVQKLAQSTGQYAPLMAAGPLGLIGDIAAGSAYSATQSPGNRKFGAEVGAGASGAANLLSKLAGSSNPIIGMAGRALMGAGVGYGAGGTKGAIEGAGVGIIAPYTLKKLGLTGEHPGVDVAKMTNPEETTARFEAGKRLGTTLTPGEASGRPDITAEEAIIGKTGVGASERVKIGQQRIAEQQQAIENLGKKISPSNEIASFDVRQAAQDSIRKMKQARQEAVEPYYQIAHSKKVAPNLIKKLSNSDANIKNAIYEASNDPKYQVEGELKGFPQNSIKVLDYAKRKIDAKIAQAKNLGDQDAVRVLNNSKNRLVKATDQFSPDFKKARELYNNLSKPIEDVENSHVGQISKLKDTNLKNLSKNVFDPAQTDLSVLKQIKQHIQSQNPEAWDTMIKNEMNRLMTQGRRGGFTGRHFFNNVLSNPNRFRQFQAALDHNPKALSDLNDMRSAWEHIVNMETPVTAAGKAKTSMDKARASVQAIVDAYNDMVGSERQIKALKYLYSSKWQSDLEKIARMPVKEQKPMRALLLAKTIVPAYILDNKEDQE